MTVPFPEPTVPASSRAEVFLRYLDYFRSRMVGRIETTDLARRGRPGPRWEGADPPPLERILFHLVQEYARHLGHLDLVTELAGGPTGE